MQKLAGDDLDVVFAVDAQPADPIEESC